MQSCPKCGFWNIDERKTCKSCGASLIAAEEPDEVGLLSLEERQVILRKEISHFVREGWRLQAQTETTAQMVKDKRANGCLLILLLCLLIVPGILYLLMFKGQDSLFIEVGGAGQVLRTQR